MVRVEDPPAVTDVGLNEAEAPEGRPLILSATVSADPDTTEVEIVEVAEVPCSSDRVEGEALMEKSLVTVPPHDANLKDPTRVFQLNAPFAGIYSWVYQKVQSSEGSTAIIE